jgi:hypothetical protein
MQIGAIRRSDNGKFELVIMLALAGLSFLGISAYLLVPFGAALLFISTMHEYAHLQPRLAKAGATRLMGGGIAAAMALSLAFASLCFAIGRAFAWFNAG